MGKRIALILCAFAVFVALYACRVEDATSSAATTLTTVPPTTQTTTVSATTTTTTVSNPTTTTTTTRPTVTEPSVSMPNDQTAWANYIVDEQYNYIADRLTKTQKNNVKKMCAAVGCKVSFEADYTKVTDAKKNVVYYSKTFGEDELVAEPGFGILTLTKRADNETVFVYKGATILNFIGYISKIEKGGFSYSAVSSVDYVKGEGIFAGGDEDGNSVIIHYSDDMVVIAVTEAKRAI